MSVIPKRLLIQSSLNINNKKKEHKHKVRTKKLFKLKKKSEREKYLIGNIIVRRIVILIRDTFGLFNSFCLNKIKSLKISNGQKI